jgi:hypothetical protein
MLKVVVVLQQGEPAAHVNNVHMHHYPLARPLFRRDG